MITVNGVRVIPVHATRKACASILVALDVHPRVAMQILRHSQIAVTMNVYSNSRELHQPGEKPQVSRSQDRRNDVPLVLMPAP